MEIEVIKTDKKFDELEGVWNFLSVNTFASFFSSFDYVRTAWSYFHKPTDRLFILLISNGSSVVGIAPLYISEQKMRGIPCRIISFIPMWEGDRPQILADGNKEEIWKEIISFLLKRYRDWEVIDLREQEVEGPAGRGWNFLYRKGLYWEQSRDAVGYYISLEGSWEEYLKSLSGNTRSDLKRKQRRLMSVPGGFTVERISDSDGIIHALMRYVTVERSGWKRDAGVGLAKNELHKSFYEEILRKLAKKGEVELYFLRCNGEDIAGMINFVHQNKAYMRHTAFCKDHSAVSPGIILLSDVTKRLINGKLQEFDLLGMREENGPQRYKMQLASGRRDSVQLTGYCVQSRILPWIIGRKMKRFLSQRSYFKSLLSQR